MGFIKIKKEDTRACLILYPRTTRGEWQKAYFHMWRVRKPLYKDEENKVIEAVVEMRNGTIMNIDPKYMRFIDRDASEFDIDNRTETIE